MTSKQRVFSHLNDINYKKDNNGYGYLFLTLEEAYYRSLYDDYCSREIRLSFGIASLIWLPHYL